ncbi:MAG TPA: cation:proton antiporter [Pyrinomonadaceae bacterium]|nr:cation:proton antiporter [Pyrinomonadaceae bacterium]
MPEFSTQKSRSLLYYLGLLLVFGAGLWLILAIGSQLKSRPPILGGAAALSTNAAVSSSPATTTSETGPGKLVGAVRSPLATLLLQIIVIIVAARLFGAVFRRIGQPPVMGEMIAGIALGPSVLGLIFPQAMGFLFPASSMNTLSVLSQIGVVLFMFIVGMELDIEHLRQKAAAAVMVSHASIIVPFLLGAALALLLYPTLAPADTSFAAFALFMGIAMSITAFPVLARILEDRGLSQSRLGSIALACAAIDDVSAWCILAVVIAIVKSAGLGTSVVTIALTLVFVGAMLFLVRPQLASLVEKRVADPKRARGLLAGVLAFVLASAWFTESIGIHALFGGFLAGVVMPSAAGFQIFLKERVEAFSSAALLPLFFVFTGLRTQISLLDDGWSWLTCLAIIVVAVTGKLGGSMLMARWTRMNWRDSFTIGALLNTRGLVELVVLNIGYDLGILSARIFVMMVIMALVTTFMTAPLLSLVRAKAQE